MGIIINTKPIPRDPIVVDFGWYYGSGPYLRKPEYTYTSNLASYPPGHTTLASSVTIPMTNGTISVTSTANFDTGTSGALVINNGTTWALINYASISGNTFVGCYSTLASVPATYPSNTNVWDPRFYVDSAPLQTLITFDALDSHNLGLNKISTPAGIRVLEWIWDFGNGARGSSPVSSTTYPFNQSPPSVHVTLTVIDNLKREFSCSHPLVLVP